MDSQLRSPITRSHAFSFLCVSSVPYLLSSVTTRTSSVRPFLLAWLLFFFRVSGSDKDAEEVTSGESEEESGF